MVEVDLLKIAYKKILIISMAIIMGSVMFAGVMYCLVVFEANSVPVVENPEFLQMLNWGIGISLIFSSFILKGIIFKSSSGTMINKLMTTTIIMLSLCEGVVLFGGVITFVTRDIQNMIAPVVMGFIGFAVHFPRYLDWEQKIQQS